MLFGILAVSDPGLPELGQINGGLPFLVKDVLGAKLGTLLLVEVVFAVFVCALAVHAGSVRLMFAMARDDNLPFAHALSHVPTRTRTPILPAVVIGVLAATILVVNINLPQVIETLCSVAIVWANLAYLLVTFPLLGLSVSAEGASATPAADPTSLTAAIPAKRRTGSFRWAGSDYRSTRSRSFGDCSSSSISAGRAPRSTVPARGAVSPPRWRLWS